MEVIFKIHITENYKLFYTVVSVEKQEILIQEEVTPCITFNTNTINFFEESQKAIQFLKNWLEAPEDYKNYEVQFQNKTYQLLPEVLFALIINEIKYKLERQYIIKNTEINKVLAIVMNKIISTFA